MVVIRIDLGSFRAMRPCGRSLHAIIIAALLAAGGCAASHEPPAVPLPAGTRRATDRNLDLAIDGDGYFIVETPAGGFLFTRRGDLAVSSSGELVNGDGYRLYPHVAVTANAAAVVVSPQGVVRLKPVEGGETEGELVGQIVLSRFPRPDAVERDGVYCMPTDASGDPVTGKPGTKGLGLVRTGELDE